MKRESVFGPAMMVLLLAGGTAPAHLALAQAPSGAPGGLTSPPSSVAVPPAASPPASPTAPPAADTPLVQVRSFQVSGNSLLPAEQLQAALAPYTGPRSLAELNQAALAVQALYRDAGYGAVVAYLPAQNTAAGEISIVVVEGRIAKVTVTGASQFDQANIRASLPALVEGRTPRVLAIDSQVQLANENPAKHLDVLLQPGAKAGEVEARIDVTEQPASRWTLGLDNTGNEQTGRWRASLGYQNAALWNRDHVLTLQFQTAPENFGDVAVFGANYRVPFYALGMALDAYAAYSDVDGGTTATAAGPLQFSGEGRIAGFRLSKYLPRLGEFDQRLVVGLDHRDYINNCSITGLPAGACGGAGESVSVQPLSLEYVVQKGGPVSLGASIGLQHNLQLGGSHADDAQFTAVRPGAEPRYTLLRFGLFTGLALPAEWQLQARLVGQLSHDALVPGEQFGVGGAASVRGYDEREVTGDSGAVGSVEVYTPDLVQLLLPAAAASGSAPPQARKDSLRLLGFADLGWARNRLGTPCLQNLDHCRLGSVGIGLRYSNGPLQLRFDVAQPLRDGNRNDRHDTRAHVAVSYSY